MSCIDPSQRRLALTGGIGSGKSYVARLLAERGWPVFSCDEVAKRLMAESVALRRELAALVGADVLLADGSLSKQRLSAYVRTSPLHAGRVGAVVHPRVAEAYEHWANQQTAAHHFMECAILYESGFDRLVDAVVHVSAPVQVRLQRVAARDGICPEDVRTWMALQQSDEQTAQRAHYRIVNDGVQPLAPQIDALLGEQPATKP